MEKGTTISISLHTADRIIDLKVPSQVTVARLKQFYKSRFQSFISDFPKILNWLF